MELRFQNPGFVYSLNSIMEFQSDEDIINWGDSLYVFYPQLDKEYALSLSRKDRQEYLEKTLERVYRENEVLIEEKVEIYGKHWQTHRQQVNEAFSEAFEMDCAGSFNDIAGNVTLNPIGPRYIDTRSFDVFYLNSERGAIGMALHEMVHFVWFDIWRRYFGDDPSEYERPYLKWILSEMVVESIMRDERLSAINPYFPRDYEKKQNGCVYGCFYDMKVEEEPILSTLYERFQSLSITDYMEWGYGYCRKHEQEIRRQMEEYL